MPIAKMLDFNKDAGCNGPVQEAEASKYKRLRFFRNRIGFCFGYTLQEYGEHCAA